MCYICTFFISQRAGDCGAGQLPNRSVRPEFQEKVNKLAQKVEVTRIVFFSGREGEDN